MWLSMWEGTHQDGSTGESTKPCQSQIIRLGLNAIPNEMAVLYTLPYHSYLINGGMFRMYQIPALWIINKIDVGVKLTLNDYLKKPNGRWTTRPTCIQQQGIYSKFDEGIYFGFFQSDKTALSSGKSHNMGLTIFFPNCCRLGRLDSYLAHLDTNFFPSSRGLMWLQLYHNSEYKLANR